MTLSVDLRGYEESHEQYDREDPFKGVDDRRDRHGEEGPGSVSDNGKEEQDRADDGQTRSQSDSAVEKGE